MTSQLTGPFYVAHYKPHDPRQPNATVKECISEHRDLADAIVSARRLTLHPTLPSKPDHACVYVEHDHAKEIVWVSV
ncbi:MAG TPA: hypothetical protein VHX44_07175 [Planctomycetota bacterium]|nr:hypothetical protein [Planctomycetota bacterium]